MILMTMMIISGGDIDEGDDIVALALQQINF